MRTITLFYSWQSDRPSDLCRRFVAEALHAAAAIIRNSRQILVIIDADTQGVAGTPPISETILKKIDTSDLFLADLTLVSRTERGKTAPNPNVLIEYGYALKSKGPHRLLLAMNSAFGGPEGLPFDLRHLRHPMQYVAEPQLPKSELRRRRAAFAEQLVVAINVAIDQLSASGRPAVGKADDVGVKAQKNLEAFRLKRASIGSGSLVFGPRVVVDILPFLALKNERLDLRLVKLARPWFAPSNDADAEIESRHGEWLSRDRPFNLGDFPNPISQWATRLVIPGHVERIFALGRRGTFGFGVNVDGASLDLAIVQALRRSGELLNAIELPGPALVQVSIENGEQVSLALDGVKRSQIQSPHISFRPIRVENLRAPDPTQVRPLLDDLWQAFDWDEGTPSISDNGWETDIETGVDLSNLVAPD